LKKPFRQVIISCATSGQALFDKLLNLEIQYPVDYPSVSEENDNAVSLETQ
jgi:hypothetical protein